MINFRFSNPAKTTENMERTFALLHRLIIFFIGITIFFITLSDTNFPFSRLVMFSNRPDQICNSLVFEQNTLVPMKNSIFPNNCISSSQLKLPESNNFLEIRKICHMVDQNNKIVKTEQVISFCDK